MSNVYSTNVYQARSLDSKGNFIKKPWTTDMDKAMRFAATLDNGWVVEVEVRIDDRDANLIEVNPSLDPSQE